MKSAYQIIRKPVITEKGLGIKETQNTLVFQVAPKATKTEIKEAVQAIFKVKVASVRTANYPGKERRRGKFAGYRPDWKKAYVRLKTGEKMPPRCPNAPPLSPGPRRCPRATGRRHRSAPGGSS